MNKNAIEVEDLTVAYKEKPVLWDIDLTVPEGVLMAIVGPNGAGTSTLLNMIAQIYGPSDGDIVFNGDVILSASTTRRRSSRRSPSATPGRCRPGGWDIPPPGSARRQVWRCSR